MTLMPTSTGREAWEDGPIVLCVLLWPRAGAEQRLIDYEDDVLKLLPDHHGRVVMRARSTEPGSGPFEIQIIEFSTEGSFTAFLADDRRTSFGSKRDAAIARTEVSRVLLIGETA